MNPIIRNAILAAVALFLAGAAALWIAGSKTDDESVAIRINNASEPNVPAAEAVADDEDAEDAAESAENLRGAAPEPSKSDATSQALIEKGYAIGDVAIGDPDAPVTVVEYASLTCPHCANFHRRTWPVFKRDYIDTGKVRFVLREIYFDQFGLWAGMLARCGGEGGYHQMVDAMLKQQADWYLDHVRAYNQTKNPQPIVEALYTIGRRAGMSDARMDACLQDQDFLEKLVADFQATSAADGVRSTPSFVINGELIAGDQTPEAMAAAIDKNL